MEYKTMHNRKFSIPFPLLAENETVDEYLSYIAKYKNYIDDIFLGVPFLITYNKLRKFNSQKI